MIGLLILMTYVSICFGLCLYKVARLADRQKALEDLLDDAISYEPTRDPFDFERNLDLGGRDEG